MATSVTSAEVLAILDTLQDGYIWMYPGLVAANSELVDIPGLVYGNGSPVPGTGDLPFISALGNTANVPLANPIFTSTPKLIFAPYFGNFTSWFSAAFGSSIST